MAKDRHKWKRTESKFPSTSATGAAAELIISVELMERGYYVARNLMPTGPFDLIAYRDGQTYLIDTKATQTKWNVRKDGTIGNPIYNKGKLTKLQIQMGVILATVCHHTGKVLSLDVPL